MKGEKIALIGSKNSGRTTLLRTLDLLEEPDKGEIIFNGKVIEPKNDLNKLRGKIGFSSKKFTLFSHLNVIDNLCLAPMKLLSMTRKDAERKAMEWLSKSGLTTQAKFMPQELSPGQQRRIAICRSLMMMPEIIFFDDSESASDSGVTSEIYAMIRMLAKHDLTMLIVTNEINFAKEIANRVIYLEDGAIYEEGTPLEIFENPKQEKTISFVRKLKYFSCVFNSCDFDLIQLQSGIQKFAEKYSLNSNLAYRLQLCSEELVYEMLFGSCKNAESIHLALEISYSNDSTIIDLVGKGSKFNPFDDEFEPENVHLGITILNKIAKKIDYEFHNGINHISVTI